MGPHFNLAFLSSSQSILHADESKSEEEAKVETKEEEEVGILWSWMELGGLPVLDEAEAQKLLQEVYSLSLLDICMGLQPFSSSVSFLHLNFCLLSRGWTC